MVFLICFGIATARAAIITVVCQNNTNDATRINNAIAASAAGDKIVIAGPALINRTIKLLGNRSYNGTGRSTVLKQAKGANLVALMASDSYLDNSQYTGDPVTVRHFTFKGNRANNRRATVGIILRSWLSDVEDVTIENFGGDGIRLTNLSANNTKLRNSQVNGRIVGNYVENCGGNGICVQDTGNSVTDWTLADNWVGNSGKNGILLENAAGWMVERNHIYGVPQDAISAHRLYGSTISDNYIEGFGEATNAGVWYGIYATLQGNVASVIANNRVFNFGGESRTNSTYRYIGIANVNYSTGVVSVVGNSIFGAGTSRGVGLYYNKGSGAGLTVASTGNAVVNVHTPRFIGPGVTNSPGL